MTRWQMNRAGALNFWYYDDDVFELSDGRLILRGANGSGKSVTMQSFLPLVLDGDKRPSRLDPFGSRDRKIEYYLLGDAESGHAERTAYLFLEFLNAKQENTLTIGIGLRARRGAAQVQFWGFSVTDGRRIGKDLFLYDQREFSLRGEKIPLDRAELEEVLGAGGRVVREQGEYRQMVNQLLFGFQDPDSYRDLLSLIIQLRSPKLSKDFRPSTIYDILNKSLPPLADHELRPLADVLRDLDEISDRLEELQTHVKSAGRLDSAYGRYNELRLYELAGRVMADVHSLEAGKGEAGEEERTWQGLSERYARAAQRIEEAQQAEASLITEIDVMDNSEAMATERELSTASSNLGQLEKDIRRARERVADLRKEIEEKRRRLEVTTNDLKANVQEQSKLVARMTELAVAAEFDNHSVYLQTFQSNHVDEGVWKGWQGDVSDYRKRLAESREHFVREQQRREKMEEEERRLSEARAERDDAEKSLQVQRQALDSSVQRYEDEFLGWFRNLMVLPLSEDGYREVLHGLVDYPGRSYDSIIGPVKDAFDEAKQDLGADRLRATHQRGLLVAERETLQAEVLTWEQQRDPEPDRTEARRHARKRRLEGVHGGGGVGAPLFMVCEFQNHVDERTQAALETALHRAGLLDAWIAPEGKEVDGEGEDTWLHPSPAVFGYTLAELLIPTPTADSGLTAERVDAALRTILLEDAVSMKAKAGEDRGALLTQSGQFSLGPLYGQVDVKPRAEWIGYETRRKTRMMEVDRLKAAISTIDDQLVTLDEQIRAIDARLEQAQLEHAALPSDADLAKAQRALQDAEYVLERARKHESGCQERHRTATSAWRETQRVLVEFMSAWQRLKTRDDVEGAADRLEVYARDGQELKSVMRIIERDLQQEMALNQEISTGHERIQDEEESLDDMGLREQDLRTRIQSLKSVLEQLGMLDVAERLGGLRAELESLRKQLPKLRDEAQTLFGDIRQSEVRLSQKRSAVETAEGRLQASAHRLEMEWALGLVTVEGVPSEHAHSNAVAAGTGIKSLAQSIVRQLRGRYASLNMNNVVFRLQETFNQENSVLIDYAMEYRFDDGLDRYVLESLRDKNRPISPTGLLAELERALEEQRILIDEKDRELYEEILLRSVGRAIKDRINRAEAWVEEMNRFMSARHTSSGLVLSLQWKAKEAKSEQELDTSRLVELLRKSPDARRRDESDQMIEHFRSRIRHAKLQADEGDTLSQWLQQLLDYRGWFEFRLFYKKGEQSRRELTDSHFNVLSGGERAMAMYIPLFAATDSRYKDSRPNAPRIVSLDEAFAGVDEENMRDMFQLLTDMGFDYMMTSQSLWGCYDTVPSLSIYEIYRPNDVHFVTLIPYYWNGYERRMMEKSDWDATGEVAATEASLIDQP